MLTAPPGPIASLHQRFKAWRKQRRRARQASARIAWQKGLNTQETFEKIYTERVWGAAPDGAKFYSGEGSDPANSAPYEAFVADVMRRNPQLNSIVDIGCGDFQVSNRILAACDRPINYVGCDIARNIVAENTRLHARPGVSFVTCNAIESDPPAGDLVLVRQVLQHLSNADIARMLGRLRRIYAAAIVTEGQPVALVAPNLDIVTGYETRLPIGSGVYIDLPPHDLVVAERMETIANKHEVLRTALLWFATPARVG